jgi:cytoplasmic FMR1 interacting protein
MGGCYCGYSCNNNNNNNNNHNNNNNNNNRYLPVKKSGAGNLLRRVVAPTETQLFVYRSLLDHLLDDNSEAMNSGSLLKARDLSKDAEVAALAHAERAFYYPYMLGFARVIDNFKDMGDLLFREYYLEVTRKVQFPLRLSLPWILVNHILARKSYVATMDDLVMVLDIYNDAGARALYDMRRQYMFNEIEAEVQIVFGELVLQLANDAYSYVPFFFFFFRACRHLCIRAFVHVGTSCIHSLTHSFP